MTTKPTLAIQSSDGRTPLVFCWGVSSFFGWGVVGLNTILSLAHDPGYVPFAAIEFGPADVVLDPLREAQMARHAEQSRGIWQALAGIADTEVEVDAPLLVALGTSLQQPAAAGGKILTGNPTIACPILEQATLDPAWRERLGRYALIIAGSTWNERILRAHGIHGVTTVWQGVDTGLFHPAPKAGLLPRDRFVIFSGGKLEFRKGQDLVMAAFRAFRQRHPEALLLTAWHSPWSDLMYSAVGRRDITVPGPNADGTPDVIGWAVANGIPAGSVIALGPTPNIAMPHVLHEADVALFPNRAEGGTNLVAMECLASGIPTILSANTGHLDLLRGDRIALPLTRQGTVTRDGLDTTGLDTTDWGESDVEEIVERLEEVWRDREAARAMGLRAAAHMTDMTWTTQIARLIRAIEPVLPDRPSAR